MGRKKKIEVVAPEKFLNVPVENFDFAGDEDDPYTVSDNLMDTLSPLSANCYMKVYKTRPLPPGSRKPQLIFDIDDVRGIKDLEIYIRDLAMKNQWGSGEYAFFTYTQPEGSTVGKIIGKAKYEIDCPKKEQIDSKPEQSAINQSPSIKNQIEETANLVKSLRELSPDTSDIIESQIRAFQQGMETAAKSEKSNGNGNSTLQLIATLKELGMIGNNNNNHSSKDDLLNLVNILKETGVISQRPVSKPDKEQDIFSEIKKFSDLGLIRLPSKDDEKKSDDTMTQIAKVMEMVNTLKPLIGKSDGASPTLELIRIIGPGIPQMVESLTSTVKEVVEVQKLKWTSKLGGMAKNILPRRKPPENTVQKINQEKIKLEKHPVIQEILTAIENNDITFYPKLRELLIINCGNHIIEELLTERISVDVFLNRLSETLKETGLRSLKACEYFSEFLSSLFINVQCLDCKQSFSIASDEWSSGEFDKKCECGGSLVEITDNLSINSSEENIGNAI